MVRKIWVGLFLLSLVFAFVSCGGAKVRVSGTENSLYSRYNLHYLPEPKGGLLVGSYANWTNGAGHEFLSYNTKIKVGYFDGKRFEFVTDGGMVILWRFDPEKMPMSTSEYIQLIMSPTPVKYEGLSDVDMQGIQQGKALPGMSKQGVMVALGYPAKHRTPSMDSDTWTYWMDRNNTYTVNFDANGKVK